MCHVCRGGGGGRDEVNCFAGGHFSKVSSAWIAGVSSATHRRCPRHEDQHINLLPCIKRGIGREW